MENLERIEPGLHEEQNHLSAARKWCSKHRTSNHDSSECFSKTSIEKNEKSKDLNKFIKNYLIKEPPYETGLLILKGIHQEEEISILIDTGSEGNYISKEMAKKLKLKSSKGNLNSRVIFGNGNSEKIMGQSQIKFKFDQNETIEWNTTIQILE